MKRLLELLVQALAGNVLGRALLRLAMRVVAPRQFVGAVGAVVNDEGKVLLVHHAYRTDFPWGLPGGWVESGENPAAAVEREIAEELKLSVRVERLLVCDIVPAVERSVAPRHLGLAFRCHLLGGEIRISHEIVDVEWIDPQRLPYDVAPFQARAIAAAVQESR